jgi:predicted phosphodiesterase
MTRHLLAPRFVIRHPAFGPLHSPRVLTRIFSDVHYGDRASRVRRLAQLRPLLDGVAHLVLNGDTLDTRPGPRPDFTAEIRAEVLAFFPQHAPHVTLLTGNHDADLTPRHTLDLAGGAVFVTHGDILFDTIVPWGRDAALIGGKITAALATLPPKSRDQLDARLAVWRRVAAAIPQRHQSESRRLRYALHFLADTIWPPLRVLRVLRAWRDEPPRAAALVQRHRPRAKFVVLGHTHRTLVQRTADGVTVINTGAFCPPFGATVVDLSPGRLLVRRVEVRGSEFHAGAAVAEFPLAGA